MKSWVFCWYFHLQTLIYFSEHRLKIDFPRGESLARRARLLLGTLLDLPRGVQIVLLSKDACASSTTIPADRNELLSPSLDKQLLIFSQQSVRCFAATGTLVIATSRRRNACFSQEDARVWLRTKSTGSSINVVDVHTISIGQSNSQGRTFKTSYLQRSQRRRNLGIGDHSSLEKTERNEAEWG